MSAQTPARLPAIPRVHTDNAALNRWMEAVTERLEVREGDRGSALEQVITRRDLASMGITSAQWTGADRTTSNVGGVLVQQPDGGYARIGMDAFADEIRKTKLYRDLQLAIDDVTRFDLVPDSIRAILLNGIADEASRRGADIQELKTRVQSATESIASSVREVTASLDRSVAGIREVSYANATANNSTAGKITQVQARIDTVGIAAADIVATIYANVGALPPAGVQGKFYQVGAGAPYALYRWDGTAWVVGGAGTSATVEATMAATADRARGANAEYMVKVSAGGHVAGFGLSASEDPGGAGTSSFAVQASTFSVVMPGLSSAIPFGVDASGVYINGSLRIGSGVGTALGAIGSGVSNAVVYAYKRSASAPTWVDSATSGPGAVTWDFATGVITTGSLLNSWSKTIPAVDGNPLYVTVSTASASTATDSIANTEWATPVKITQDGVSGTAGLNVGSPMLYQRNASGVTAPTLPSASITYTFSSGGMSGINNGWTATVPASGGAYLWVTHATASSTAASDSIGSGEWSVATLMSSDGAGGTPGSPGTRGTVTTSIGAYSDAAAAAKVLAITGTNPIVGDIVYYTGGAKECTVAGSPGTWVAVAAFIDGSLVATGTIASAKLAAGISITTSGYLDVTGNTPSGVQASGRFNTGSTAEQGIFANSGTTAFASAGVWGGTNSLNTYGVRGSSGTLAGTGVYGTATGTGTAIEANSSTGTAFVATGTSRFTGQITSTYGAGAPFVIAAGAASYTVSNLNVHYLGGYTSAGFLRLDGTTSATGMTTSTNIPNLNASFLGGYTSDNFLRRDSSNSTSGMTATTLVTNLNADYLDGYNGDAYLRVTASSLTSLGSTFDGHLTITAAGSTIRIPFYF
jgi:hypothetical protein